MIYRMFKSFRSIFLTMLTGIVALLAFCIYLFEGKMIPAVWQLASICWVMYCANKYTYEDCKVKANKVDNAEVERQVLAAMKAVIKN